MYSSAVSKDIIQWYICIFHLHLRTHFNSADYFIEISDFFLKNVFFIHHADFRIFKRGFKIGFFHDFVIRETNVGVLC